MPRKPTLKLAFLTHAGTACPRLKFTIARQTYENIVLESRSEARALAQVGEAYLGTHTPFMWAPHQVLPRIGYGGCGRVFVRPHDVDIVVIYSNHSRAKLIALTVSVLLQRLSGLGGTGAVPENLIDITTWCNPHEHLASHPIGGHVHSPMLRWIREFGSKNAPRRASAWSFDGADLPSPIQYAMRDAWWVLAPPDMKRYSKHCRARAGKKGTLLFSCPGDACDAGIYPDDLPSESEDEDDDHIVRFSCHNVDTPWQQLTLLAGVAALCDRVAFDLKHGNQP